MKKIIYIFIIIFTIFSCEDVIEVDVPNAPPRLVIDASLNWFEGTAGNEQEIKLSLSAPYFNTSVPPANNAIVTVIDANNNTYNFIEIESTGIYTNNTFIPEIDLEYTLIIEYQGETYEATETLKSVAPIDFIEQINDGGFTGEDIEIKAFYTDPENVENYYFFEFYKENNNQPIFDAYEDEFTDGNQIFAFYSDDDLEQGDELTIRNYGISNQYFNYTFLLLQQILQDGGGPFEVQTATVRGNCVNTTNPDNFPFGYFRVSQATEFIHIIE